MGAFKFAKGEEPDYLEKVYGIPLQDGFNIGKIMRDDFQFVDSKMELGVQIADLLSAGFRRCLRGGFEENKSIAKLLGTLLVHDLKKDFPVCLVGFTEHPIEDNICINSLEIMKVNAQSILKS
jgi:hypothetical protein